MLNRVCSLILIGLATHAAATAAVETTPIAPAPPCADTLERPAPLPFTGRPAGRYAPAAILAYPDYAGFTVFPERARGKKRLAFGELRHASGSWTTEDWSVPSTRQFFIDVGLINLSTDALLVNGLVLSEMLGAESPYLNLSNARSRREDLQNLIRFRDALAGDHRSQNSYVDTIGILRDRLPWSADAATIAEHLSISAQIHYGQRADFLAPTGHPSLERLLFQPPVAEPLPMIETLPPESEAFRRLYGQKFLGESMCEVTFPTGNFAALHVETQRRLMLQILQRASSRGCTALITAQGDQLTRRLTAEYKFKRWQALPGTPRRFAAVLFLDSAEYVDVFGRLLGQIPAPEARRGLTFIPASPREQTEGRGPESLWNPNDLPGPYESMSRRSLARRYQRYQLSDEDKFAATEFSQDDEGADKYWVTLPDYDLDRPWDIRYWPEYSTAGRHFFFYDMGFARLEANARAVNAYVAHKLNQKPDASWRFEASTYRRLTLNTLDRFRWAFHERVIDEYRRRPSKRAYFSKADYEAMALANQNSNVDVFGATDRSLPLSATREQIREALMMTFQISYDRPADYLRPSRDGLLAAYGELPVTPRSLPFMFRLRADRREDFTEAFWRSYGQLRVCEIARYTKHPRTPDQIEARMLLEGLLRLAERGCQLVVASQNGSVSKLFEEFGFIFDRYLPNRGEKPEYLVALHVNSPQFWDTFGRVARAAHPHGVWR